MEFEVKDGIVDVKIGPPTDTVNVMGTIYRIEVRKTDDDPYLTANNYEAYCSQESRLIVLSDYRVKKDFPNLLPGDYPVMWKTMLRHELVHAFLDECGLGGMASEYDGPWSKNEEMVDWLAIVGPKIMEAWKVCGCL